MGNELIAAMQASPFKDFEIEPERIPMTARDIEL